MIVSDVKSLIVELAFYDGAAGGLLRFDFNTCPLYVTLSSRLMVHDFVVVTVVMSRLSIVPHEAQTQRHSLGQGLSLLNLMPHDACMFKAS